MCRAAQPGELDVARYRHAHERAELSVKVIRRKIRKAAQRFDREVTVEVAINVGEYGIKPFRVLGEQFLVGQRWGL